jgi:hypothetical protein
MRSHDAVSHVVRIDRDEEIIKTIHHGSTTCCSGMELSQPYLTKYKRLSLSHHTSVPSALPFGGAAVVAYASVTSENISHLDPMIHQQDLVLQRTS